MNLIIDIGNTRTKLAVFEEGKLCFVRSVQDVCIDDVLFSDIKNVIYSCVGVGNQALFDYLSSNYRFIDMSMPLQIPISNHYLSKHSLGQDRLAGVVGASRLFEKQNTLVIDAGSCITIDLIDRDKNYFGGSISCGIQMKYKALNTFTASLPLVENELEKQDIIGRDTREAISSGVINGTVMEIKGYIEYYREKYTDLKIVFTGGDASFLGNYFNDIIIEEHLVLHGLNTILDANV